MAANAPQSKLVAGNMPVPGSTQRPGESKKRFSYDKLAEQVLPALENSNCQCPPNMCKCYSEDVLNNLRRQRRRHTKMREHERREGENPGTTGARMKSSLQALVRKLEAKRSGSPVTPYLEEAEIAPDGNGPETERCVKLAALGIWPGHLGHGLNKIDPEHYERKTTGRAWMSSEEYDTKCKQPDEEEKEVKRKNRTVKFRNYVPPRAFCKATELCCQSSYCSRQTLIEMMNEEEPLKTVIHDAQTGEELTREEEEEEKKKEKEGEESSGKGPAMTLTMEEEKKDHEFYAMIPKYHHHNNYKDSFNEMLEYPTVFCLSIDFDDVTFVDIDPAKSFEEKRQKKILERAASDRGKGDASSSQKINKNANRIQDVTPAKLRLPRPFGVSNKLPRDFANVNQNKGRTKPLPPDDQVIISPRTETFPESAARADKKPTVGDDEKSENKESDKTDLSVSFKDIPGIRNDEYDEKSEERRSPEPTKKDEQREDSLNTVNITIKEPERQESTPESTSRVTTSTPDGPVPNSNDSMMDMDERPLDSETGFAHANPNKNDVTMGSTRTDPFEDSVYTSVDESINASYRQSITTAIGLDSPLHIKDGFDPVKNKKKTRESPLMNFRRLDQRQRPSSALSSPNISPHRKSSLKKTPSAGTSPARTSPFYGNVSTLNDAAMTPNQTDETECQTATDPNDASNDTITTSSKRKIRFDKTDRVYEVEGDWTKDPATDEPHLVAKVSYQPAKYMEHLEADSLDDYDYDEYDADVIDEVWNEALQERFPEATIEEIYEDDFESQSDGEDGALGNRNNSCHLISSPPSSDIERNVSPEETFHFLEMRQRDQKSEAVCLLDTLEDSSSNDIVERDGHSRETKDKTPSTATSVEERGLRSDRNKLVLQRRTLGWKTDSCTSLPSNGSTSSSIFPEIATEPNTAGEGGSKKTQPDIPKWIM